MIGVNISGSCYLFLIAMQDSLRYYFADDNDSWFFSINLLTFEILKSGERLNFFGPSNRKQFEMLSTLKFSWLLIVEF